MDWLFLFSFLNPKFWGAKTPSAPPLPLLCSPWWGLRWSTFNLYQVFNILFAPDIDHQFARIVQNQQYCFIHWFFFEIDVTFDFSHKSDLQSVIVELFAIMQASQYFWNLKLWPLSNGIYCKHDMQAIHNSKSIN